MKLKDFHYELPECFIAQRPVPERDRARLMVLNRRRRNVEHHFFYDIPKFFEPGDVLVLNDTKVFPARLIGHKLNSGKVEILLLKNIGGNDWEALVRPSNKFKKGARASISRNGFTAEALNDHQSENSHRLVRLHSEDGENVEQKISAHGHMPLPPYVKRADTAEDRERYQTVFARATGAVAVPTAGLHFTPALLNNLGNMGVSIILITLHVGYGTFKPVTSERLQDHKMYAETFSISEEAADTINRREGRLIACGTTVIRALESAANSDGKVSAMSGETDMFIYPPHHFKTADALITNFHLPHSTLLMLVSAFGGHKNIMNAYEEAKRYGYRFYSYGDAMFLERS
ncbi:MAG: tRNA preQ1(34) S-adenosylmethionine ribosyltransferase-isomerase QueA [Candidatus Omnitrophica bacterium]|nr:tRNA preQ1(34) S-adenosylmethionine ribosyltransferase-isomerase QueA [Candidatus Omnitrophota bacterium]